MPRSRLKASCLFPCLLLVGCEQVILPDLPDPPPFPPDLETEVTLRSGLVLRAFGEIVSTGPTVVRITATVTNPTSTEIIARTLSGECQMIVVASWPEDVRMVQPLDGMGLSGGPLGVCGTRPATRAIGAGEMIELSKREDLILSQVLGSAFVPGRNVISVIFVDEFIYEALAIDIPIRD